MSSEKSIKKVTSNRIYVGSIGIAGTCIYQLKKLKAEHETQGLLAITKRIEIAILNLDKTNIGTDEIVKWVSYVFNVGVQDAKGWIFDQITTHT